MRTTMIDLGDLRKFARALGKWLYAVNPDLDTNKVKTLILQFAKAAPIGIGEASAPSVDEFCAEALKGYAPDEEPSQL
jgi:hypothetical protein